MRNGLIPVTDASKPVDILETLAFITQRNRARMELQDARLQDAADVAEWNREYSRVRKAGGK